MNTDHRTRSAPAHHTPRVAHTPAISANRGRARYRPARRRHSHPARPRPARRPPIRPPSTAPHPAPQPPATPPPGPMGRRRIRCSRPHRSACPKGAARSAASARSSAPTRSPAPASFTVPIATSPGRSGFGPTLTLSLRLRARQRPVRARLEPSTARRSPAAPTRCCPLYRDADESDVFILSGAEDLVPVLDDDHGGGRGWTSATDYAPGFRVDRYRPRIEGLFARIERWTDTADRRRALALDHPRQRHHPLRRRPPDSRIADPHDPGRVFAG